MGLTRCQVIVGGLFQDRHIWITGIYQGAIRLKPTFVWISFLVRMLQHKDSFILWNLKKKLQKRYNSINFPLLPWQPKIVQNWKFVLIIWQWIYLCIIYLGSKPIDLDSPWNQDVVMHVGIKMYLGVNLGAEFVVPFSSHSRSLALKLSLKNLSNDSFFDQNYKLFT